MDDNLEWLTQKTEDSKSNKGNLTFPTHTVNVIELSGNKKVATPHFYINPPFSDLSPVSSKKFQTSPRDSIFGRSYPPPLIRGGGVQLCKVNKRRQFTFVRTKQVILLTTLPIFDWQKPKPTMLQPRWHWN